ncbi:MAG: hypothetical protein HY060_20765 [Proteobacteria bacterium]|nr:hypothetical protein [Pseudomonadota bacterium]
MAGVALHRPFRDGLARSAYHFIDGLSGSLLLAATILYRQWSATPAIPSHPHIPQEGDRARRGVAATRDRGAQTLQRQISRKFFS